MSNDPSTPGTIPVPPGRHESESSIPPPLTDQLQTAVAEWNVLLHHQPPVTRPATKRMDIHLSPENLFNNVPWGDSLQQKETNTFRIYCQNANGLHLDHQGGKCAMILRKWNWK
jgi:hypothetical protein